VAEWLEAELTERHQVDTEQEALWASAALAWDLVLGSVDGPSSLAASPSMVAKLFESRVDSAAANGVRWGLLRSGHLCHFSELKSELELLRSGQNVDLTDDQADALWPLVSAASDSLVSILPSSHARIPHDDVGE
jgi:hypothetical protein